MSTSREPAPPRVVPGGASRTPAGTRTNVFVAAAGTERRSRRRPVSSRHSNPWRGLSDWRVAAGAAFLALFVLFCVLFPWRPGIRTLVSREVYTKGDLAVFTAEQVAGLPEHTRRMLGGEAEVDIGGWRYERYTPHATGIFTGGKFAKERHEVYVAKRDLRLSLVYVMTILDDIASVQVFDLTNPEPFLRL